MVGRGSNPTYPARVIDRMVFLRGLGRRVRSLRTAAGLTQEALAERARVSTKYLSDVERGKVNASIAVLYELAEQGLGISLIALLNFSIDLDEGRRTREELTGLVEGQPPEARRRALRALDAFFGPLN